MRAHTPSSSVRQANPIHAFFLALGAVDVSALPRRTLADLLVLKIVHAIQQKQKTAQATTALAGSFLVSG